MNFRVVGFGILLAAAFGMGTTVYADSGVSSISQAQYSSLDESCGVLPQNPESTIYRRRTYDVYCNYQCDGNPSEVCSPYASKVHEVTATGKCGTIQCKGVVDPGYDAGWQGSYPNEEHIHRIHYENMFINGSSCNIQTQGNSERYFDFIYNDEMCTIPGRCPDQQTEYEQCIAGESTWWDFADCDCKTSPILLDLDGDGLALTDPRFGARFDLDRNGRREAISWPQPRTRDPFLVLDRNTNGQIDDGGELFGSTTDQPVVRKKNGFLALAVFDSLQNGGNADGLISKQDGVFSRLRAWFDLNHDAVSQPHELRPLEALNVRRISLEYEVSNGRDRDSFGNVFLFKGWMEIGDTGRGRLTRQPVIDVFLKNGGRPR